MNSFIKLNRLKLKFAFKILSLIFLSIAIVLLIVSFFIGEFPKIQWIILILLIAGAGFPVFILLLTYLGWHDNRAARNRQFSAHPFDQLGSIGFQKSYINAQNKWHLTEEIQTGTINGFIMQLDVNRDNKATIAAFAATEWMQLDKLGYRYLEDKFKPYGIEFRIGGLAKIYDRKKISFHTIHELKNDLEFFTAILKQEGFKPLKDG